MCEKSFLQEENGRGLFSAPEESEADFVARCRAAVPRYKRGFSPRAADVFDIDPDWVEIRYDNRPLRFWEAGCTLVEEGHPILYLRRQLEKAERFFGYEREEIVAHELVHIVRSGWNEARFEECLAYQTSKSPFRRFWGPLFRTPRESLCTLLLLLLVNGALLVGIAVGIAYTLFFAWVGIGVVRLVYTQARFRQAQKKLLFFIEKERVLALMLRMRDREIAYVACHNRDEILSYLREQKKCSLRWQHIFFAYEKSLRCKVFPTPNS